MEMLFKPFGDAVAKQFAKMVRHAKRTDANHADIRDGLRKAGTHRRYRAVSA